MNLSFMEWAYGLAFLVFVGVGLSNIRDGLRYWRHSGKSILLGAGALYTAIGLAGLWLIVHHRA